jgi:hypothetical protein
MAFLLEEVGRRQGAAAIRAPFFLLHWGGHFKSTWESVNIFRMELREL